MGDSKALLWRGLWEVPGDWEPTTLCQPPACSEYHERVRAQGQQLQHLQAELDKLHKEVSRVRAANSEVSPAHPALRNPALTAGAQGCPGAPPAARSLPLETPF